LRLPIPGGYMDIDATTVGDETIPANTQIMVHPSRADLDFEILEDTYLTVNSVGKDVFGGIYLDEKGRRVDNLEGNENLFEVVGAFVGYLEGNNQEGCQRTLAALTTAEEKILAEAARIGGLENRITLAQDVLNFQKLDQQERLSYVEDIDLTELLTKLTQQQLTYQTVLQSSSMIMNLSLANYV
ncbi:MAG: flagellar hook protein, partial [Desulfovibrionaceae bacterium]|nr:flagellar hook protein [Desulfovibrionaceae bacterium]